MLQTYTGKCSYTAGSSQGGFVVAPPQAAAATIVVVAVSHVIKNQNLLGCERLPTKKGWRPGHGGRSERMSTKFKR
jgi:hypothetical protein